MKHFNPRFRFRENLSRKLVRYVCGWQQQVRVVMSLRHWLFLSRLVVTNKLTVPWYFEYLYLTTEKKGRGRRKNRKYWIYGNWIHSVPRRWKSYRSKKLLASNSKLRYTNTSSLKITLFFESRYISKDKWQSCEKSTKNDWISTLKTENYELSFLW